MIKLKLSLVMLLLCLFAGGMKAKDELSTLLVSNGTSSQGMVPFHGYAFDKNSRSQYVVPATELKNMIGGGIHCLMYFCTSDNSGKMPGGKVKIYMKEVNYTAMTEFEPVSDNDLVFYDYLKADETDPNSLLITFNKPYLYKGGNLLICFENTPTTENTVKKFYGKKTDYVTGLMTYNIGQEPGEAHFLPKTAFIYYPPTTAIRGTFTTPDIAALAWSGQSDSYQLRYSEMSFFEDFENGLDGWLVASHGDHTDLTEWQPVPNTGSNNGSYEGNYGVISNSYCNGVGYDIDNWLISPKVRLGGKLKYWVFCSNKNWPDHYSVYVSTTAKSQEDTLTFQLLASPGDPTSTWTEVSIDLSAYEGKMGYIAFRDKCKDQLNMVIDNVGIYGCKSEWQVVDNATSPYYIEGLESDKYYLLEVYGISGTTDEDKRKTSWTQAKVFTDANPTPDDVEVDRGKNDATIKWTGYGDYYEMAYRKSAKKHYLLQSFEKGYDGWKLQNCHDKTGGSSNPIAACDGNSGLAFYTMQASGPQYLISPRIARATAGTYLSFYYKNYNTGYTESFMVGYSSTTDDIDAFNFGETISTSKNEWIHFEEEIPVGTKYICIKCTSSKKHYLFMDLFEVYKPQEKSDYIAIGGITSQSTTLTGLEPGTEYEYALRSQKAKAKNKTSALTEIMSFITQVPLQLANNDAALAQKNIDIIEENYNQSAEVTLTDRTLYKDGDWNTLCLPFDVTLKGSPLEGATVMKMDGEKSSLNNGKLSLSFVDEKEVLTAGTPYIIKWETKDDDIKDPVFTGVTISSTTPTEVMSNDNNVSFVGQYSPFNIVKSGATGDNEGNIDEIILLSAKNQLGYSKNPRTLHALRCHFKTYSYEKARSYEIDFGEGETTGIVSISDGRDMMSDGWYDLQGRKLSKMPTAKGLYINNGKVVEIK
jgi:hypothetical protein